MSTQETSNYTCKYPEETVHNNSEPAFSSFGMAVVSMNEPQDALGDDLPVLNREELSALTGGDAEFEKELLGAYYESTPSILEELGKAVRAVDIPNVVYRAHTLKGSSKSIGADATTAAALDLETAGRQNDVEVLPAAYENLGRAMAELFDVLDRILQEP